MIAVLINIVVLAVVFGLILWVLTQAPIPEPFGNIVRVVVMVIGVLILLLLLLQLVGVGPGVPLIVRP